MQLEFYFELIVKHSTISYQNKSANENADEEA